MTIDVNTKPRSPGIAIRFQVRHSLVTGLVSLGFAQKWIHILLQAPRPAGKARATSIPGVVCKERATQLAGLRAAACKGAAPGGHSLPRSISVIVCRAMTSSVGRPPQAPKCEVISARALKGSRVVHPAEESPTMMS